MKATVEHRQVRDPNDEAATQARDAVRVGRTDDPAEHAAEAMADRARTLADEYGNITGAAPGGGSATIRRYAPTAAHDDSYDGLVVERDALQRASSSGHGLADADQESLEQSYGTSLNDVRVHTGSDAAGLADGMNAAAFTSGSDIYFGKGKYEPGTQDGDHLLAHEVAHTVQNGAGSDASIHRFPNGALTAPVPWKTLTSTVVRPSEGKSGGVYILNSKDADGDLKKVVAKPVFSGKNGIGEMETPEAVVAGDKMLRSFFGMNTPQSRIAKKGTPEYADLLSLCLPHAPAKDTRGAEERGLDEAGPDKGLDEADAFVVMGAVEGKSIASMAAKAGDDTDSFDMLQRTLFNQNILEQMGRLAIADMMLGNKDRITAGAMNLGNMMVSAANGKLDLWAIDTLVGLPAYDPKSFAKDGIGGGWQSSAKKDLNAGPVSILDGVFEIIGKQIERGITDPEAAKAPTAPHTVMTQRYATEKAIVLGHFTRGWEGALAQAATLSTRMGERKESHDGPKDPDNLTAEALRANIAYLGARANDGTDADASGIGLAEVLKNYVRTIDIDGIAPPRDALSPQNFSAPPKDAIGADVPDTPSLTTQDLAALKPNNSGRQNATQSGRNQLFATHVTTAHNEVNAAVDPHKVRKKGITRKTTVLPRNRNLIGHFVVDAKASTAGAFRAISAVRSLQGISEQLELASTATFKKGTAGAVIAAMNRVDVLANGLRSIAGDFRRQAAVASQVIPSTKMAGAAAFTTVQATVNDYMDKAVVGLDAIKQAKLGESAATLAKAN